MDKFNFSSHSINKTEKGASVTAPSVTYKGSHKTYTVSLGSAKVGVDNPLSPHDSITGVSVSGPSLTMHTHGSPVAVTVGKLTMGGAYEKTKMPDGNTQHSVDVPGTAFSFGLIKSPTKPPSSTTKPPLPPVTSPNADKKIASILHPFFDQFS